MLVTNQNSVVNPVNPSISLAALKKSSKVVVSTTTAVAHIPSIDELKSLEKARLNWENVELAASNNRLYSILYKSYKFYLEMKEDDDKDVRKAKRDAMETFIEQRGYTNSFGATTHDMTRVVKCVFGVDRRRVSAYSIALREALRQEVDAEDLVEFLEQNGGVEQIRMGGTKPLSAKTRAELGKAAVGETVICKVKLDARVVQANPDWVDQQVVFVATYLPTGEFEVNAVVKHDGAVKTALAAYYTLGKAKEREELQKLKKELAAAEAKEKAEAEAKATPKTTKVEKTAKQKAKVAKELAEKNQLASKKAAFDSLVVEATT